MALAEAYASGVQRVWGGLGVGVRGPVPVALQAGDSGAQNGLCLPEKPIRFTEFHDHRQVLGGPASQLAKAGTCFLSRGPGQSGWLDRQFIPSTQTPT